MSPSLLNITPELTASVATKTAAVKALLADIAKPERCARRQALHQHIEALILDLAERQARERGGSSHSHGFGSNGEKGRFTLV